MSIDPVNEPPEPSERIARTSFARRFVRNRVAMTGVILLAFVLIAAIWPTDWLPHSPFSGVQADRFIPPGSEYLLGTEALGRDILSMLIAGARYTLIVAVGASIISVIVGVTLGLIAGYFRSAADAVIMRLVDIQMAFPELILIIAVIAIFGPGLWNLVIILGITGWAPYARLTRSAVLSVRERGFIKASESLGVSAGYTIRKHVLPNIRGTVVVYLTSDLARLVLLESALSFLGLGVQPPTPSWGAMIADGRQYMFEAWWASAIPGIAIVLTVLAVNFIGDEVRDLLDPKAHRDNLGQRMRKRMMRR